jgi:hypothetical protein
MAYLIQQTTRLGCPSAASVRLRAFQIALSRESALPKVIVVQGYLAPFLVCARFIEN